MKFVILLATVSAAAAFALNHSLVNNKLDETNDLDSLNIYNHTEDNHRQERQSLSNPRGAKNVVDSAAGLGNGQ